MFLAWNEVDMGGMQISEEFCPHANPFALAKALN
jgi:hypothetical protein